jgi:hypothetical protein
MVPPSALAKATMVSASKSASGWGKKATVWPGPRFNKLSNMISIIDYQ